MIFQQAKKNFLPVAYGLFFVGFFFLPTSKVHSNLYYIAVLLPFLGMVFFGNITLKPLLSSRVFALTFIFLVYMWLTLWWSNDFFLKDIFVAGRRVVSILVFISVTVYLIQTRQHFLKHLFQGFTLAATAVAVMYPFLFYARHPFPESRLVGYWLLYNPIMASSIYAIAIFGCLYLLHDQTEGKKRFMYLFSLPCLFSYILFAQSRGPFGALILTCIILVLLRAIITKKLSNYFVKGCVVSILITAVVIGFHLMFPDFFRDFISGRGLSYRLDIWEFFLGKIKLAPIWGHGLNANNIALLAGNTFLHPHSVYIATLYYGGAVGLSLLVALIGYAIFKAMTFQDRQQQLIAVSTMVYGSLCIITDSYTLIQHPQPLWMFFWFPVALCIAFEIEHGFPVQKRWHHKEVVPGI